MAYDLYTLDRDFLERYLKVQYGSNDSLRYTQRAVTGGIFKGLPDFYLYPDDGGSTQTVAPYRITSPDRTGTAYTDTPLNRGRGSLTYWNSGWLSGIDYTGGFGIEYDSGAVREVSTSLSKLVLPFDAACINDTAARRTVLQRVVTHFDSTSIAGRVEIEGMDGDAGALVTLHRTDHTETRTAVTDAMGRFAFDTVAAGNWQVDVTKNGWLAARSAILAAAPDLDHFLAVTLRAGDANTDQKINILDACPVKSRAAAADFNHDGDVDDLDMKYIRINYGAIGY